MWDFVWITLSLWLDVVFYTTLELVPTHSVGWKIQVLQQDESRYIILYSQCRKRMVIYADIILQTSHERHQIFTHQLLKLCLSMRAVLKVTSALESADFVYCIYCIHSNYTCL